MLRVTHILSNLVKPEATPHEIEMAIDLDEAPQIFAHSVCMTI
jgi:t-SNARE complex subunit (syntaxin)